MLVACDVYRPAAIEQLKVLGEQIQVPVYSDETTKDPVRIALDAIKQAKAKGYDVVIVDTAGRLAIDEQMMNEIAAIKEAIHPNETLFVVDAMTGQDAVNTAREFNERLDFNGVILTKLDGDTRGGGRSFYPYGSEQTDQVCRNRRETRSFGRLPSRTYGRPYSGDGRYRVPGRKGSGTVRCRRSQKLQKKISRNQFNFNDFLSQIQQIKKMGNIKDLASMIPGVGKALKDIDIDDDAFKGVEAIIYSMTAAEREDPALINGSRRKRIAEGSGTTVQDVNRLLKQFEESKKMMKMLSGGGKLMRKMPGMRR